MALPIGFAKANVTLGPPGGMEDAVVPLPVLRLINGQLISCWQLTSEEIEVVVRTKRIWLSVLGGMSQPPVMIAAKLEQLVEG